MPKRRILSQSNEVCIADGESVTDKTFHQRRFANLKNVTFHDCTFSAASFRRITLDNVSFVNCDFEDSDFSYAILLRTSFADGIDRSPPEDFSHACLRGSRFTKVNLQRTRFCSADIRDTIFSGCLSQHADFRRAILNGETVFQGTTLEDAIWIEAPVESATFIPYSERRLAINASLRQAHFESASQKLRLDSFPKQIVEKIKSSLWLATSSFLVSLVVVVFCLFTFIYWCDFPVNATVQVALSKESPPKTELLTTKLPRDSVTQNTTVDSSSIDPGDVVSHRSLIDGVSGPRFSKDAFLYLNWNRVFQAAYFEIATLSTVGYGDLKPHPQMTWAKPIVAANIAFMYFLLIVLAARVANWLRSLP